MIKIIDRENDCEIVIQKVSIAEGHRAVVIERFVEGKKESAMSITESLLPEFIKGLEGLTDGNR